MECRPPQDETRMSLTSLIFDLIDFRSFSNLWYWIALSASSGPAPAIGSWACPTTWSGAPGAKGGEALETLETLVRINTGRMLFHSREYGVGMVGFLAFLVTTLILGRALPSEFALAFLLIVLPLAARLSLAAGLPEDRGRRGAGRGAAAPAFRHRVSIQALGLAAIFVAAMVGMYVNCCTWSRDEPLPPRAAPPRAMTRGFWRARRPRAPRSSTSPATTAGPRPWRGRCASSRARGGRPGLPGLGLLALRPGLSQPRRFPRGGWRRLPRAQGVKGAFVLLTTMAAATQRIPAREVVAGMSFSAAVGDRVDEGRLKAFLANMGFPRSRPWRSRGLCASGRDRRHLPAGAGRAGQARLLWRHARQHPPLRPGNAKDRGQA